PLTQAQNDNAHVRSTRGRNRCIDKCDSCQYPFCLMKKMLAVFLLSALCSAQHLVKKEVFNAIANEYSGERAQENVRSIVEYSRIQGSPMMAAVANDVVLAKLKKFGIESSVEQWTSDGKTMYGTYISPMGWDMRGGELWIKSAASDKNFKPVRLCRYAD